MPTESHLQSAVAEMIRRLVAEYAPERVILFGSHAYGHPAPDSDLDLLIVKETTDRFLDRLWTVRRILAGETQEVPIEVLVLTPQELRDRLAIGDQFFAAIVDQGEVLYAR